jgi:hypothetical protein
VIHVDNEMLVKYGGFTVLGNKLFKAVQVRLR